MPAPLAPDMPRAFRALVRVLRPPVRALSRRDWAGAENLPPQGQGFIVASNHVSEYDPITLAHYLVDHGYTPRFLAKEGLFTAPVVGPVMTAVGQIPVLRGSARAAESLRAAEEALADGACVVVMPEGTLTRDPDLWPMEGKTGTARLALRTNVPVLPAGQWGAQQLLAPYARFPSRPWARHRVHVRIGPPVELDDLRAGPLTATALREATARIMRGITTEVAAVRGGTPPATPFRPDPAAPHPKRGARRAPGDS